MRRVRARIRLTNDERNELKVLINKRTSSQATVQRAQIIMRADRLQSNTAVANELNISLRTVMLWTHRWKDLKDENKPVIDRLSDAARTGKPNTITAEQLCH